MSSPNAQIAEDSALMRVVVPGIFGSPQPSQVRRGSIPQPVKSRRNANDEPSRFIKATPAFAYFPRSKKQSLTDVRRAYGPINAARALKELRNCPASNTSHSQLS